MKAIRANSCAEDAGISVGDEVIGCNGFRVNQVMLEGMMNGLSISETAELLLSREEKLFSVKVKMTNIRKPQFQFQRDVGGENEVLFDFWLR